MSGTQPEEVSGSARVRKPPPHATALSAPYWRAAAQGRLLLQRCRACRNWQHYPRALCAGCWSAGLSWETASGSGQVWSYTIAHRPAHPAWRDDVPYCIALVTLAEGPRVLANLVGCEPGRAHIGLSVQAVFEARGDYTAVQFAPADRVPSQGRTTP